MVHSAEQVADGMIKLIQKVLGARAVLTSDANTGTNILKVPNSFHFSDTDSIVIFDIVPDHVEYHTILKVLDTTTLALVNTVQSDFATANQATVQKAIGNVPMSENAVLLGDRKVIPNPDITVTVDPQKITNIEWVVLPGGMSVEYSVVVTAYAKLDESEKAHRVALKYGDALLELFNTNLHLDVVNDEFPITSDVSAGDTIIPIAATTGLVADTEMKYEVQDNKTAETFFAISSILSSPPRVVLDRALTYSYKVADKALFRKRVRYIYNSLVSDVDLGFLQRGSAVYKAARLTWWGRETGDYKFDQTTHGGIT